MLSLVKNRADNKLPSFVQDVSTATCLFCPYGAEVKTGDRLYAFDEKTAFGRRRRERLVEVTAVKNFRSNGRVITLDLKIASAAELAKIALDSEMPVEAILSHRANSDTFDPLRPPVVVYFEPCDEDDTIGSQFKLRSKR